jgi:arylsulfatase G
MKCTGKWHLGHGFGYSPTFRGFQTWYGLPYSGDMGCIDATPQGCKPSYDRTKGQPACPALCPVDAAAPIAGDVAIPLYDSSGLNCSGHASCNADIVMQPFDPVR